jgi:hypothetical protein
VIQILAFEINLRAAHHFGPAFGVINRAGAPDKMFQLAAEFGDKLGIVLVARVAFPQLGKGMGQRLGDKAAAVLTEMALGVGQVVWRCLRQRRRRDRLTLGVISERIKIFHGCFLCSSALMGVRRVCQTHGVHEGMYFDGILDSLAVFDAAADIDGVGTHANDCVSRVLYAQATT